MYLFGLLFFLFQTTLILCDKLSEKWNCTNYYWRDYFGYIPSDAITAGNDSNGDPLFIGLVYITNFEYLPATIIPKKRIARTTAYDKVFEKSEHVKILCSPYARAFQWIETTSQNLQDHYHLKLIPGGSEVGENLYIGRVFRNDNAIIGKIFKHHRTNKGIWFPHAGSYHNSLNYEILTYDCSKNFYVGNKGVICVNTMLPLDLVN